jgi:hypothetical protein
MAYGVREMAFSLNPRYNRTLTSAIREMEKKANTEVEIISHIGEHYVLRMSSDSQEFINLQAKLRNKTMGPIERRVLSRRRGRRN